MNKNEFLNELKVRLKILDDTEIEDIVNEYSQIIDEKVKNGKTEIEAVNDFGNVDELVKEILSAYKINPNYKKTTNSGVDDFLNGINEGIKFIAGKIVDFGSKIVNSIKEESKDEKDTVTVIIEWLLKGILILFVIAILRIPFLIISSIGSSILEIGNMSLSKTLVITFQILIDILYIVFCIYFASLIAKKIILNKEKNNNSSKYIKIETNRDTVFDYKEDVNESDKIVNNNNDYNNKYNRNDEYNEMKNYIGCSNIFVILFKIVILIFLVIPGIAILVVGLLMLIFFFILTVTGLPFIGLCITTVGGIVLVSTFLEMFIGILNGKSNFSISSIIVSIILILVGSTVFTNTILKLEYISDPYKETTNLKTAINTFEITDDIIVKTENYEFSKEVDNNLPHNQISITVLYHDLVIDDIKILKDDNIISFEYYLKSDNGFEQLKILLNKVKKDIKNNKIYNYDKMTDFKIEIKANEQVIDKVKIVED